VPEETAPLALDVQRVRRALAGTRFADVRYSTETGSTNDDATPLLGRPEHAGTTLVAEFQSAGRGRQAGRRWIARAGTALLFTTILPDAVAARVLWAVPFWVALRVAEGIARTGIDVDLRWPNDIFLHDRKVAGILCVSRVAGEIAHVGCGIGINVVRPADDALGDVIPLPAFLSDARPVAREDVLTAILTAFDRELRSLHEPAAVRERYQERAALDGAPYRVRLDRDGSELDGVARGLGAEGTLLLDVAGVMHEIALADARRL
jgi:BirA family biotin operon repressor/biotin-[acetyl-CoA-carboxylase] ligase